MFQVAFDVAPIGMAVTDATGAYIRVNDALCELLGRTRGELVGANVTDVTHPDDMVANAAARRQ